MCYLLFKSINHLGLTFMNDVRSRFTFFPSMDIQLTESHLLNSPWLLHSITFFTFELNQVTINIWICFYIIYFVTLVCLFILVQDQTVFIAIALQQVLRSGKLMFNVYNILILEWVALGNMEAVFTYSVKFGRMGH